ncbi:MAG: long-chain fatty acid--CoA ligase, partial [Gemmatimonadota bacterium]|nr:long-chain fatty acid--CoA ligase [Gemmatimonadota bacterium]
MSTMHPFTLPELVEQWLPDRGADEALVQGEASLSYAELWGRSGALAYGLDQLGLRKGDRVVVHMPKSTFEAVATYGVSRLGGIVVNVNSNVTTRQLRHVLENSGARVALVHSRAAAGLAAEGIPSSLECVVVIDGDAPEEQAFMPLDAVPADGNAPSVRLIDRDGCALIYTSGSTGLPKGVLLTHETVVQSARSAATHLRNCADDRALGVLPLSFDFGLSQLTTMALVGGTLVMPRASLPAELLRTVGEFEVNALAMVPTMWIPFVRLLQKKEVRLPQVRYVANSGGPLPTDVQRAWPTVFPEARHYLMYGMTEGFRSSYLPPEDFQRKLGSIGVPLPNVELFVVHPERGLCGPKEHGELLHRGNLVSEGYYRNPEATREKIKPCPHLSHLIGDEPV